MQPDNYDENGWFAKGNSVRNTGRTRFKKGHIESAEVKLGRAEWTNYFKEARA